MQQNSHFKQYPSKMFLAVVHRFQSYLIESEHFLKNTATCAKLRKKTSPQLLKFCLSLMSSMNRKLSDFLKVKQSASKFQLPILRLPKILDALPRLTSKN